MFPSVGDLEGPTSFLQQVGVIEGTPGVSSQPPPGLGSPHGSRAEKWATAKKWEEVRGLRHTGDAVGSKGHAEHEDDEKRPQQCHEHRFLLTNCSALASMAHPVSRCTFWPASRGGKAWLA